MRSRLFVGNDNVIELEHLRNQLTDAAVDDATVSVTLLDASDVEVTGVVWPINMAYDAADALYRAILPATLPIEVGDYYTAVVTATGVSGEVGRWHLGLQAVERGAC